MFSECNPAKASGVSLLAVLATAKLTAGFSTHLKYSLDHSNLSFKAWGIFACHFANSLLIASSIWLELGAVTPTFHGCLVDPHQIILRASHAVFPTPCPLLIATRSLPATLKLASLCHPSGKSSGQISRSNASGSRYHLSNTASCAAVSPLTSDIYFPIFFQNFQNNTTDREGRTGLRRRGDGTGCGSVWLGCKHAFPSTLLYIMHIVRCALQQSGVINDLTLYH